VWIGGNGEKDSHILKFTKEGKLLMQVGKMGLKNGSNDAQNFGRVAKIWVDPKTNEAYVADGYRNKRVAVLDADSGKMKRYWGAYGNKPDDTDLGKYDPPRRRRGSSAIRCTASSAATTASSTSATPGRPHPGVQSRRHVRKGSAFREEHAGLGLGMDIAFSRDPQQKYIFLADGTNEVVRVVDRDTLKEVTNFGDGGRQPGQFYGVHSIATDSKGNIYTTETYEGKRLQKFAYKGMGRVPSGNQGVVWPRS